MNLCTILLLCAAASASWQGSGTQASEDPKAIIRAAERGDAGRLQVLLQDPHLNPGADGNSAICRAAEYGHAKCVSLLLADPRVNPADNVNYALRFAAKGGHAECVGLLLRHPGVDPTADDNRALFWAAGGGHVECVRRLLADGRMKLGTTSNNPIQAAAENGHAECLRLLLEDRRTDPAAYGDSPLVDAVIGGHVECVRLLLADRRVDPAKALGLECTPEIQGLVACIQPYKDNDLAAFQHEKLAALPDEVLDILASRTRHTSMILQGRVFKAQLARVDASKEAKERQEHQEDPAYGKLIESAASRIPWRTGEFRDLVEYFTIMRILGGLPSELARPIVARAYGLAV